MPETLQKQTNTSLMPSAYYDMFAYRLLGLTYKDIAEKTGYSHGFVRTLFSKGNVIYNFWREYVQEKKAEITEEHQDMMWGHLSDSTRRLMLHAIHGKGLVSLEAIKTHFKYTVGEPQAKVKIDATLGVYNFADWAKSVAESIKEKENEINPAGAVIKDIPK